jgi:hypothetical protein
VPPGHVYLLPYKSENYTQMAQALHIPPHPRAHFQNAALLPYRYYDALCFVNLLSKAVDAHCCPQTPVPHAWLCRGSFFLLADARACPLLPKSWRVLPSGSMLTVAGQRGQSCSAVCRCVMRCQYPDKQVQQGSSNVKCRHRTLVCTLLCCGCRARGQECSADDFWFLNSCNILRQHFACKLGCTTGPGPDLPSYVGDERLSTFHQCLVSGAIQPTTPGQSSESVA